MCGWCEVRSICVTNSSALFIQDSELILTEINQQCHLLVEWEGLVFLLSQTEESFHEGLQTHSCKEKVFIGGRFIAHCSLANYIL